MDDRERSYFVVCMICLACAAGTTILVWMKAPLVGNPWPGVVCFAIYAALAELLTVSTDEGQGVSISPTSPILWAATCVLGPLPAIAVSASYSLLTLVIRYICYYSALRMSSRAEQTAGGARRAMYDLMVGIGGYVRSRGITPTLLVLAFCVSSNIIIVGPSGLAYQALGGAFLVHAYPDRMATEFILPFLALVMVSIIFEHTIYVAGMVVMNPLPAAKDALYTALLRAKLILIEDVLPVWRGQVFLVVVALLLSYLYMHIGFWGFVLTIMPVLALRDFFRQWIEERAAYVDTITTLATYMQHYHPYTRGHLKRVADLSERVARELKLPAESVRHITTAAFLHDIGKIGVSEEILDKTEKLTDDEWGVIKEHPVKGAEIISHIEFLEGIADWIRYHHKWHNGAGYPAVDIEGSAIPIEAAIIATVDAFDAMTDDRELTLDWKCDSCGYKPANGDRPHVCPQCGAAKSRTYRPPKSMDAAIDELRRGAGSQFHPKVVKAFLSMIERDGLRYNVG